MQILLNIFTACDFDYHLENTVQELIRTDNQTLWLEQKLLMFILELLLRNPSISENLFMIVVGFVTTQYDN